MTKQNYFRIGPSIAYVFLMFVSTWATAESISKLDQEWANSKLYIALIWFFSIILFCMSAYGTSLIVQSLDKSVRVHNRLLKLLCGSGLMLIFWIIFILPTNTHTFFYKSIIKDETITELELTEGYLKDLLNKGEAGKIIAIEKQGFINTVNSLFTQYATEINNPGLPGNGDRAEKVLVQMQEVLGGQIQRITLRSNSLSDRRIFIDAMQQQINSLRDLKLAEYDLKLSNLNQGIDEEEINALLEKIQTTESRLLRYKEGLLMPEEARIAKREPTAATRAILITSFQIIEKYYNGLREVYPNSRSRLGYTTPKIVQLERVIEVWQLFFRGAYKGQGFVFWIIVSTLIDLAGFVTFHYAFRNRQDF